MGKEVLSQRLPDEFEDIAKSLIISTHIFFDDSITQLAHVLTSCANLQLLRFSGRSLLSLSSSVGRPLPNMRTLDLSADRGLSTDEFTAVLNMVPNLRVSNQLPPTHYPLDGTALREKRLERLSLEPWHRTALPLLFSRYWTTRHLTLLFAPLTWQFFEELDRSLPTGALADTRSLTLILSTSRDGGPAVLLPLIFACHLRQLDLRAKADDLTALLPVVLAECRGLHALDLRIFSSPPPAVLSLVDALLAVLPGPLRSLSFSYAASHVPALSALGPTCRAHRVVFTLKQ